MIYLCDFEDSFTYNIHSEILAMTTDIPIQVIHKKNIVKFLNRLCSIEDKSLLILGPGPGLPDDYPGVELPLKTLLEHKQIFILGICLGHQLLWKILGAQLRRCSQPIHGKSVKYELDQQVMSDFGFSKEIQVQHYNSFCVDFNSTTVDIAKKNQLSLFHHNNELIMSRSTHILSYQFHPESIGTTCPRSFFVPALDFLL